MRLSEILSYFSVVWERCERKCVICVVCLSCQTCSKKIIILFLCKTVIFVLLIKR